MSQKIQRWTGKATKAASKGHTPRRGYKQVLGITGEIHPDMPERIICNIETNETFDNLPSMVRAMGPAGFNSTYKVLYLPIGVSRDTFVMKREDIKHLVTRMVELATAMNVEVWRTKDERGCGFAISLMRKESPVTVVGAPGERVYNIYARGTPAPDNLVAVSQAGEDAYDMAQELACAIGNLAYKTFLSSSAENLLDQFIARISHKKAGRKPSTLRGKFKFLTKYVQDA